jgi:hypothetical protein
MTDDPATDTPSPDEAFAALGDETRLSILRILGRADGPLAFSELYDRADADDSGGFNYHLDRLVGHFVEKTDDGYALARPGQRVVEAVRSGAVTETPALARTAVDETCRHCGAPVEIQYRDGSVEMYCTECPGTYGHVHDDGGGVREAPEGYLGRLPFPPAGLADRTPDETLRAAWTWGNLEMLAMASGICPRCGASVEYTVTRACDDHDPGEGYCTACDRIHGVTLAISCSNCPFESGGFAAIGLLANTALLDLLTDHGINPVAPTSIHRADAVHGTYDEDIISTDPFAARFTFAVGDDTLALTVDEAFDVVETERRAD